jgi:hypothetical protein
VSAGNGRHGVPDTHVWNPETGKYLAPGGDPGAMLKRTAAERHADPRVTHPGSPPVAPIPAPAAPTRTPALLALCSLDSTDDQGHPNGAAPDCASRGNLLACQLCPQSPTYWRNTARPPAADPWDNTLPMGGTRIEASVSPAEVWKGTLNWGKGSGAWWEWGKPKPCVICTVKTEQRSPKSKPCHKACAERWEHAKANGLPLPAPQPR